MQVDYDPERHAMVIPIGEGGAVTYGSTMVTAHNDTHDMVTVELRILRPRHPGSPLRRMAGMFAPPEDADATE